MHGGPLIAIASVNMQLTRHEVLSRMEPFKHGRAGHNCEYNVSFHGIQSLFPCMQFSQSISRRHASSNRGKHLREEGMGSTRARNILPTSEYGTDTRMVAPSHEAYSPRNMADGNPRLNWLNWHTNTEAHLNLGLRLGYGNSLRSSYSCSGT